MKTKILKIVSYVFGVFAICGLSLFSFLDYKKDTQQVNATITYENFYTQLGSDSFTQNTNYLNFQGYVLDVSINGNYNLVGRTQIALNDNNNTSQVSLYYYLTFSGSLFVEYNDTEFIFNRNLDFSVDCYFPISRGGIEYKGIFDIRTKFYESDGLRMYLYVNGELYNSVIYDRLNGNTGNSDGLIYFDNESIYGGFVNTTLNTYSVFSFNYDFDISPYSQGYNDGFLAGLSQGQDNGYNSGYNDGQLFGYDSGYNEGYDVGYTLGFDSGSDTGYSDGVASQLPLIQEAYTSGYSDGYNEGYTSDSTVSTIFSNILLVGMLPVDIFLRILNWEFLGINIASFVSALISVAATVIVIRLVTGKKND